MAKIDFFLVVLLIPCNEILCSLQKNGNNHLKQNLLNQYQFSKSNTTLPKFYKGRHPSKPKELIIHTTNNVKNTRSSPSISKHENPYSEHEKPRDVSTRPKYTTSGKLVHPKKKEEILDFVPTKLYAQVRGTHTVKRVPKKQALEEAKTDEEKENANRLREVVTNKKSNTIYTEEGYEDSAYDHAGHVRDADFEEQFGRKLHNKYDEKAEKNDPKKRKGIVRGSRRDVDEAESLRKVKKLNEDNSSKTVVQKGLKQLEKDIIREIEETEKEADEYHAEISEVKDEDHGEEEDDESRNNVKNSSLEKGDTKKIEVFQEDDDDDYNFDDEDDEGNTKYSDDLSYSRENSKESYSGENSREKSSENSKENSREYTEPTSNSFERDKSIEVSKPKVEVTTTSSEEFTTYSTKIPEKILHFPTQPPSNLNFGDVLWQGFKQRQKQRSSNNPNKLQSLVNNQNSISSANNEKPHFEKLVGTPETLIPTIPPSSINYLKSSNLDEFRIQPEIDVSNTYNSWSLLTPKPEPIVSFQSFTTPELFAFNQELTTSYPTTFYDTAETVSTTTEKSTPYDHNPFLSPFAKQFDGKLKRYTFVVRDHSTKKPESENQTIHAPKYNNYQQNKTVHNPAPPYKNSYVKQPYYSTDYKYRPLPHRNLNGVPSANELRIMKPPAPPKVVNKYVRRPIQTYSNYYHPVVNDYYPIRVAKSHVYPSHGINPPAPGIQNLYTLYNQPYARNYQTLPSSIYSKVVHPNYNTKSNGRYPNKIILRYKRSIFNPMFINVSNTIFYNNNSENNSHNKRSLKNSEHSDFLNKTSEIPENVVDKEIKIRFPESKENEDEHKEEEEREKVEVEVPELDDYVDNKEEYEKKDYPDAEEEKIDPEKYPYYDSDLSKQYSTLKYIMNPNYVPKKTFGGMEFYDSRILACNDVEPNLDDVPLDGEEPTTTRGYNEDLPRLNGLGDKLDCFKAKFFDPNPLDNPLFMEKRIDQLEIPVEIDPKAFSSRISDWSADRDDYTREKLSKKPEYDDMDDQKMQTSRKRKIKHRPYPQRYKYPRRPPSAIKIRVKKKRKSRPISTTQLVPLRLYGNQVYDDVMGIIQKSKKPRKPARPNGRRRRKQHRSSSNKNNNWSEPDQDYDISAVKLRFVPHNVKGTMNSPLENDDSSLPIVNIPSFQMPKRVRIHNNKPYETIHIRKPKGGKLIVNYRTLPGLDDYYRNDEYGRRRHSHNIMKRSVSVENKEMDDYDEVVMNSHQGKRLSKEELIEQPVRNVTDKTIYRVPVRYKNARPDGQQFTGRHGQFVPEPMTSRTEDQRRKEPRYNPIEEENVSTTNKAPLRIIVNDPMTRRPVTSPMDYSMSYPAQTVIRINHGSHYNSTNSTDTKPKIMYQEIIRKDSKPESDVKVVPKKPIIKHYEVTENPEEKSKESPKTEEEHSDDQEEDYDDDEEEKEESRNDEEDDEEDDTGNDDESSDEKSSNFRSRSSKDDEEDSEEDEDDDEHSFSRFHYRPWSPAEYYEDPKYSDLGPRVNKPFFHHPRFSVPKYERYKFGKHVDTSDEESDENSRERNRYVYPWERNEEEDEESKHSRSVKRYEYPWEKRERLAKQRKHHHYDHSEEEDDEDEEDEEEAASSEDHYSYRRPFNVRVYATPKMKRKKHRNLAEDNEEETSNVKPTVSQPKIQPNITVSKVNRTIIEIIKSPILPVNNLVKNVTLKQEFFGTSTMKPELGKMLKGITDAITTTPPVASMQGKLDVEILKTNPKKVERTLGAENLGSTTAAFLRRRRVGLQNNPNVLTFSTTAQTVWNRRRPVPSTDS